MPHPESEHGLRVQLATAQHGLDEWCKAAMQERARAEKAESERDALRAENGRLRAALGEALEWILGEGSIVPERLVGRIKAALASGGDRG